VARLKIEEVSLKLVNQGIQQFDISKSSDQNALGKAKQVEDYKKDLKLKDEEKTEFILEKANMEAIQCWTHRRCYRCSRNGTVKEL